MEVGGEGEAGPERKIVNVLFEIQLEVYLHTIVDEPLKSGQGSNHDNPGSKSLPEASEAKGLHSSTNAGTRSLVQVGDKGVGRMGDDGTEDASNVTSCEGHDELLTL